MKRKEQLIINNFMREHDIDHSSVVRRNHPFHPKESWEHALAKFKKAWEIYKEGRPVWMEALTKDHKRRYDLLDPLGEGIIEITHKGKSHGDGDKEIKL